MKKIPLIITFFLFVAMQTISTAATFVVDNTADNDNFLPYTISDGTNSLRKCIRLAFLLGGTNTINFNIGGAAPYVINQTGGNFNLYTSDLTIDATTQPGWAGNPVVVLRGTGGGESFQLNGTRLTLKGVIIQNFQYGINVNNNTGGHIFQNCWFGVNAAGNATAGNTISDYGFWIKNGCPNTLIGSTVTLTNATRCVVSGCNKVGIFIDGAGTNTVVCNCYVGTDAGGTIGLGNGTNEPQNHHGIDINNSQNVSVLNSVISFNYGAGIEIRGGSNNAIIKGNMIGTDYTGNFPLGNKSVGIRARASSGHVIGGVTVAERNVISANGSSAITNAANGAATTYDWYNMCGIYTEDVGNFQIVGNYIGTSANGSTTTQSVANDLGNFYSGIKIVAWNNNAAENITIGGATANHRNVIGGNGHRGFAANAAYPGHGIQFQTNTLGYNENNYVYNNYIGVGANGVANIGNRQDGVSLFGFVRNIYIGGNGLGNLLGNNSFGVFIQNNCQSNFILGNYIGLDATGTLPCGNTAGGVCVQWNSTGNYVGRANAGEGNVISGNNGASGVIFRNGGSPAGNGNNNFVYNNIIGLQPDGASTVPGTNSNGVYIQGGSTGNTIGGTAANQRNIISGNFQHGIMMDGAVSNFVYGNYIGLDINGVKKQNVLNGVYITGASTGNQIGAVNQRNIISGNGLMGIQIDGAGNFQNVIRSNYIGTDVSGTTKIANFNNGIWVLNVNAASLANATTIGGLAANEGNVISGNNEMGVKIEASPFTKVHGNYIGTELTASSDLGNGFHGVDVISGSNSTNIQNNVISGNGDLGTPSLGNGISVTSSSSLTVTGNFLGTNLAGTTKIANHLAGYSCSSSNNSFIGGAALAQRNIISGNDDVGIYMNLSTGNTIQNNFIGTTVSGNAGLGNTTFGVYMTNGANSNTFRGNVISANGTTAGTHDGIILVGASSNSFFDNKIGVGANGTTDLGNINNGITVSASSASNIIGGINVGEANMIAYNNSNGVVIDGAASINNSMHHNSFFCNDLRAIVLANGGNNNYAKPVISVSGANLLATGPVGSFIEVYTLDGCNDCSSSTTSDKLQGKVLVFSGASPFTFTPAAGTTYTAIASAANSTAAHNTSEFSTCYVLCLAATAPTSATVDRNNICTNDNGTILLTAVGGAGTSLEWYSGACATGTIEGIGNNLVIPSPTTTTTYFVRWLDASCGNSSCASVVVTIKDLNTDPVTATVNRNNFCTNDAGNIILSSTGGVGDSLVWYSGSCAGTKIGKGSSLTIPSPTVNTDYFVRWENGVCPASNCLPVNVVTNAAPTPSINNASTYCANTSNISLSTTDNSGSGNTYSWTTTGGLSSTGSTTTASLILNVGNSGGNVSVTETAGSCSTTVTAPIGITPATTQSSAGGDKNLCVSTFTLNGNNPSVGSGEWIQVVGTSTFSPNAFTHNAVVSNMSNGLNQYVWRITGTCGVDDDTVNLTTGAAGIGVNAFTTPDTACFGTPKEIQVLVNGNGSGLYTYSWTSSDNSFTATTTTPNVTVTPNNTTTLYYVTIVDKINTGCNAGDTVKIHAIQGQDLDVPTLITPNDDGKNDFLEIRDKTSKMAILPGSSIEIMNRWGDRVYLHSSYDNSWNAHSLSDGVYFYYINSGCGDKDYKGWVQIVH